MSGRSPARFLAPVALIATCIALFTLIGSGGGGDEETPVDPGGNQPAATSPSSKARSDSSKKSSAASSKRYTVKPGDTPSSIAEKAEMPLERLLELNPDIDPQALSPGQKLKLE